MKFFLQAEKIPTCTFFITGFLFVKTFFAIFLTKIFFAFSVRAGSTEKNRSQRQKLARKICKSSKVDFNFKLKSALFLCVNFSAVSLTSVLSAAHKNPQKIFSVLVFRLPKRQNKTNSGENQNDSKTENLPFQR